MSETTKLRLNLIQKIHKLSLDKLTEINTLLTEIEGNIKSKEKTLKLAGSWKELENEFFEELTDNLHSNRLNDRQIN